MKMFRLCAGVVLPIFRFEPQAPHNATPRKGGVAPLRDLTHCGYMGHHAEPRYIANTYYATVPAGSHGFAFAAQQLPVTDALWPWVPLVRDLNASELLAPGMASNDSKGAGPAEADSNNAASEIWGFPTRSNASSEAMSRYHMRKLHLTQPFGSKLAVFQYPAEQAGPARFKPQGSQFTLGKCPDGRRAAAACSGGDRR